MYHQVTTMGTVGLVLFRRMQRVIWKCYTNGQLVVARKRYMKIEYHVLGTVPINQVTRLTNMSLIGVLAY